jgi:hypothetical protein
VPHKARKVRPSNECKSMPPLGRIEIPHNMGQVMPNIAPKVAPCNVCIVKPHNGRKVMPHMARKLRLTMCAKPYRTLHTHRGNRQFKVTEMSGLPFLILHDLLIKGAAFYEGIDTVNIASAEPQPKDIRTLRVRDPWD